MNNILLAPLIKESALPLEQAENLDHLMEAIGESKIVMLGEASHGTKEYYLWRSTLSQRLMKEKGFNFIAVEGDWPECYEVNRFIKSDAAFTAENYKEVLRYFKRWPTWMWANEEISQSLQWLLDFNQGQSSLKKGGFFGLDIYSLWESIEVILNYIKGHKPEFLEQARQAYNCFEPFGRDAHQYAGYVSFVDQSCEEEFIGLLASVRKNWNAYKEDEEGYFNIEQNALIIKNAEAYYRTMLQGDEKSWNLRDQHMFDTLERLLRFHGKDSKAIVWAHNTHIGDARYTPMKKAGLINIGQLAREKYGPDQVFLAGFGSYQGKLIASQNWEGAMKKMPLPKAKEGSFEALLHALNPRNQLLIFNEKEKEKENKAFNEPLPHRAVGVIYAPERYHGNYVSSIIPRRYDAFLYFNHSQALNPLNIEGWEAGEIAETYPHGV